MKALRNSRKNIAYKNRKKTHKRKRKITRKPRIKKPVKKSKKNNKKGGLMLVTYIQQIVSEMTFSKVSSMGIELLSQPLIIDAIYDIIEQSIHRPDNIDSHLNYVRNLYSNKRNYVLPSNSKDIGVEKIRKAMILDPDESNQIQIVSQITAYKSFTILAQKIMFMMFTENHYNKFLELLVSNNIKVRG